MSYCRFSSDNWLSDVYAYPSERGFDLHVAHCRHAGDIPPLANILEVEASVFYESYMVQMSALDKSERVPIGGRYDGQSFTFSTARELRDFLLELKEIGYHVPDTAVEILNEDIGL